MVDTSAGGICDHNIIHPFGLGHQRIQMFHPSFCGRALRQGVFGIAAFGHDAGGQSNAVIQLGIKAVEPLGNQRCAQQHQYPHQQG